MQAMKQRLPVSTSQMLILLIFREIPNLGFMILSGTQMDRGDQERPAILK